MFEPVKLSLETFQPNKCSAPYLNTPRSLEACRIHGVHPVELVEVPFNEFQRDFPNDADAVRRRYERVNGARLRVLAAVQQEWKGLVESKWKPPQAARPRSAKETIIPVNPQAHCKLLEQQAEMFRKIEQDNWDTLTRTLKLQLMKADEAVKHKAIVEKHAAIEAANDNIALERKAIRDELYRQQLLKQREEQEEELREIKRQQQEAMEEALRQQQRHIENKRQERLRLEQKESERVRSEQYTQQVRESITATIENKLDMSKKTSEVRAQNEQARIQQFLDEKQRERESKRNAVDQKIQATQAEKERRAEEEREAVLAKIRAHDAHRAAVAAQREQQRKMASTANDTATYEKMMRSKEVKDSIVKNKSERTLQYLQHKEDITKQEMERVREAQARRQTIKAIRQEAHEIALLRAQKAEEYKREKLLQQLQDKEERAAAIKQGFFTLNQMRNSMKDVMMRTNLKLSAEMNRLRHTNSFSPDKVVNKALSVSEKVLFPSLQRKFTIKDPDEEDPVQKLFNHQDDDADVGKSMMMNTQPAMAIAGNEDADAEPLYEGDRTMRAQTAGATVQGKRKVADFAPLPIHAITHSNFRNALLDSMKKVEHLNNLDSFGRPQSPLPSPTHRAIASNRHRDDEDDDVDVDSHAILKLPDEAGSHVSAHSTSSSRRSPTLLSTLTPVSRKNAAHAASEILAKEQEKKEKRQREKEALQRVSKGHQARDDDPKLPMFAFAADSEFAERKDVEDDADAASPTNRGEEEQKKSSTKFDPRKYAKKHVEIRTDVNEKAKFMKTPTGKFRREFSADHPLAAKGTGKYSKELNKGLTPTGLDLPAPKTEVSQTMALVDKVERLTFEATTRVVDADKSIEEIEKELKAALADIISEERSAEEERTETLLHLKDAAEKARLESIFAEERQRASERIVKATKDHDEALKKAMLATVNLGL